MCSLQNLFGMGKKKQAPAPQAAPQDAIAMLDGKIETLYKR
jgi:hypothetical protein